MILFLTLTYDNVPHAIKLHSKIAHSLFYSDHETDASTKLA